MCSIQTLRADVDVYRVRRLSDRWTDEELCEYFRVSPQELALILDLSI